MSTASVPTSHENQQQENQKNEQDCYQPDQGTRYSRLFNHVVDKIRRHAKTLRQSNTLWAIVRLTIMWGREKTPISLADLGAEAGIDPKHLKPILNELQREGLIIRELVQQGKQYGKTVIGLNPAFFGQLLVPDDTRNRLETHPGGRGQVSPQVGPKSGPGGRPQVGNEKDEKPNENKVPSGAETTGTNQTRNTTTETPVVVKGIPWEKAKAELLQIYPNDADRLEFAYRKISKDKGYQTCKDSIHSAAGFIRGGWAYIREDFEHVDETARQRRRQEERDREAEQQPVEQIQPSGFQPIALDVMAKFRQQNQAQFRKLDRERAERERARQH